MIVVDTIQSEPGSYLQLGMCEMNRACLSTAPELEVRRISARKSGGHSYDVTTVYGREGKEVMTMESRVWLDRELCSATSSVPVDAHIEQEYDTNGSRWTGIMIIRLKADNHREWNIRMPESYFLRRRPWYYTRTKVMSPLAITYSARMIFPLARMTNNPEAFRKEHFPDYPREQFDELCRKVQGRINKHSATSYLGVIRKAKVRMLSLTELAAKYRVSKEERDQASYIVPEEAAGE